MEEFNGSLDVNRGKNGNRCVNYKYCKKEAAATMVGLENFLKMTIPLLPSRLGNSKLECH